MSRGYRGKSESQAIAEARTTTYSVEQERSLLSRDRIAREPRTLRQYVYELRKALRDETPIRLHRAGEENLDAGGVPEMTGAFLSLLDRPQAGEDRGHWFEGADAACGRCHVLRELHSDPAFLDYYRTPYRAAMAAWERSLDPRPRRWARIVTDIVEVGLSVDQAMEMAQAHPHDADLVALTVCRRFWRDMSDLRLRTKPKRNE